MSSSGRRSRMDRESRYKRVKTIGRGSYGVVDLVQGPGKKLYVMKRITVEKEKLAGAMREVDMLKRVSHPNIVDFVEAFQSNDGSQLCIVMAYCENGDLTAYIKAARKKGKMIPEAQLMEWVVQICMALSHLHSQKLLHRDIKPHNVFLTGSGRIVKVGDFGVTKLLENTAAMAKTTIGTPYYVSPEICKERPYSYPSDVWALGVVMYELCALTVPFNAKDFPSLRREILSSKPLALSRRYSIHLRKLVGEMINKDPTRRPSIKDIMLRPYVQTHLRALIAHHSKPKAPAPAPAPTPAPAPAPAPAPPADAGAGPAVPAPAPAPAPAPTARAPTTEDRKEAEHLLEVQAQTEAELNEKRGKLAQLRRKVVADEMRAALEGGGGAAGSGAEAFPSSADRRRLSGAGGGRPAEESKLVEEPPVSAAAREVEQLETEVAALNGELLATTLKVHSLVKKTEVEADLGAVLEVASKDATPEVEIGLAPSASDSAAGAGAGGGGGGGGGGGSAAAGRSHTPVAAAPVLPEPSPILERVEESLFNTLERREDHSSAHIGDVGKQVLLAVSNGSMPGESGESSPLATASVVSSPLNRAVAIPTSDNTPRRTSHSHAHAHAHPHEHHHHHHHHHHAAASASSTSSASISSPRRHRAEHPHEAQHMPSLSTPTSTSTPTRHTPRRSSRPDSASHRGRRASRTGSAAGEHSHHHPAAHSPYTPGSAGPGGFSPSPPTAGMRAGATGAGSASRTGLRGDAPSPSPPSSSLQRAGSSNPRRSFSRASVGSAASGYSGSADTSHYTTAAYARAAAREDLRRSESRGSDVYTPRVLNSRGSMFQYDDSRDSVDGRSYSRGYIVGNASSRSSIPMPSEFSRQLDTAALESLEQYERRVGSREGWYGAETRRSTGSYSRMTPRVGSAASTSGHTPRLSTPGSTGSYSRRRSSAAAQGVAPLPSLTPRKDSGGTPRRPSARHSTASTTLESSEHSRSNLFA